MNPMDVPYGTMQNSCIPDALLDQLLAGADLEFYLADVVARSERANQIIRTPEDLNLDSDSAIYQFLHHF